jgi:hypothetical protein
MNKSGILGIVVAVISAPFVMADGWVAYNDCVDTTPASTPVNATSFGLGRSYTGDGSSGTLINFDTGAGTDVMVTFTENFSAGNTINWATDAADYTPGTDAAEIFGGKLNLSGNMSYNDSPGWSLDMTFSNLDPNVSYTFAATVHRSGGESYASRVTNWSLSGAESSTYACSDGALKISDTSAEFSTGNNTAGLVARWTDIRAGADGTFTIRTSHGIGETSGGIVGADAYRGYAGGVFMLKAQPTAGAFQISAVDYASGSDSATITWPAISGCKYAVDASYDLITWGELQNNVPFTGNTATFTEANVAAPDGRRFYRVRQVP